MSLLAGEEGAGRIHLPIGRILWQPVVTLCVESVVVLDDDTCGYNASMNKPTVSAPAIDAPHALAVEKVIAKFEVDVERGLTTAEAATRRSRYGGNRLPDAVVRPWWLRFASQFNQLVVWILIAAAVIAGATGDLIDTVAILAIVLLNGVLGFVQEERAEQALESLKKMAVPATRVRRNGELKSLPACELVPGDVVLLEAGDSVPADARLIEAYVLSLQEAALTGESVPVEKNARQVVQAAVAPADRTNMIFFGTAVAAGKGTAIVTSTGASTELGRIAGMLAREEREPTPLQKRLAELGRILVIVCLTIVAIIAGLLLLRGMPLMEVLMPAISLAVAAVPEGLPAVVTVALALGLRRLVRRNALVRKLPSVETLGSVTVICTDKTGTLTRNEMTVRELIVGDVGYEITGTGYEPHGEFQPRPIDEAASPVNDDNLELALLIGARCNNSQVTSKDGSGRWEVLGDPTEGALVVAAMKHGLAPSDNSWQLEYEIPFDSTRKLMSAAYRRGDGTRVMYVKGAPEAVLALSRARRIDGKDELLTDDDRTSVLRQNTEMAGRALRVLALAYRDDPPPSGDGNAEAELTFVGLVGMIDPPRDEVRDAVALCRQAGIRPVMITGDHPGTAEAIARELGILSDEAPAVVSGRELDQFDDTELERRVTQTSVYARVTAEHKLRVVHAWKRRGHIVAMTGDGVNDAPAVKAADIGIAMGITGTDVTKEASDMVLTDDNFTSIVHAVEEGRGILDNIQKVIHYLLACNAGEVLLMLFAAILGLPVPLTALQILWINLITDGLPALALAVEPPEPNLMRRKPRLPDASLISWKQGRLILWHGLLLSFTSLAAFAVVRYIAPDDLAAARLTTFCVTAFAQLFFALACRSERLTWPQLGWFTNAPLLLAIAGSALLQLAVTVPLAAYGKVGPALLDPRIWLSASALALTPVSLFEIGKLIYAYRRRTVGK